MTRLKDLLADANAGYFVLFCLMLAGLLLWLVVATIAESCSKRRRDARIVLAARREASAASMKADADRH